jgi:hypothetical protein
MAYTITRLTSHTGAEITDTSFYAPAIWRVFAGINLPNHPKELAQDPHNPKLTSFSAAC